MSVSICQIKILLTCLVTMNDFFPNHNCKDSEQTAHQNHETSYGDNNEVEDGPLVDEQGRKHAPIMKAKLLKSGRKYVPELSKHIVMRRLDLTVSEWNQIRGLVRSLVQSHRLDSRDRSGKIIGWSRRNASYFLPHAVGGKITANKAV